MINLTISLNFQETEENDENFCSPSVDKSPSSFWPNRSPRYVPKETTPTAKAAKKALKRARSVSIAATFFWNLNIRNGKIFFLCDICFYSKYQTIGQSAHALKIKLDATPLLAHQMAVFKSPFQES